MDAPTGLLLIVLYFGIGIYITGYAGCFNVVQNSTSFFSPIIWVVSDTLLSLMRLGICAWSPKRTDAPPLEIILELDKYEHKLLPTCNEDNEDILRYKVLPLSRARDFLKIITSFAGLIEPFRYPDLSLYYTLTRKRPSKESAPEDIKNEHRDSNNEPEDATNHKLGESILYITVFDHKDRTTRVYTRDNGRDTFYSTKSDALNVGHFLLEVEINVQVDPKDDPVLSNDSDIMNSLRKHHQSILEHIHYRLGAGNETRPYYVIENSWTMKADDTISSLQRLREEGNGNGWAMVVENGKEMEK